MEYDFTCDCDAEKFPLIEKAVGGANSYDNNMVDAQRLNSTLTVPRGQWVTIGQISQTSISSGSRTSSSNNNAPVALLVQ